MPLNSHLTFHPSRNQMRWSQYKQVLPTPEKNSVIILVKKCGRLYFILLLVLSSPNPPAGDMSPQFAILQRAIRVENPRTLVFEASSG
ncbi:hypothetical protein BJY04DRAFT_110093 [Aspergillus karnatakaensis]|uniref:uncharacterized protein n=1 Tax=Aspergillus karnatakaensis TaxID=1810916 RepID=UPI003CCD7619